jgi:hypothetical protein
MGNGSRLKSPRQANYPAHTWIVRIIKIHLLWIGKIQGSTLTLARILPSTYAKYMTKAHTHVIFLGVAGFGAGVFFEGEIS